MDKIQRYDETQCSLVVAITCISLVHVLFTQGLPPVNPVLLGDEEHRRLLDQATHNGLMRREYIAHSLFEEDD